VDRLDPVETGHARHFPPLDGVPYGGFTSAIRDHSGAPWFASYSGLSRFVPEPSGVPRIPNVLIAALPAGGEDYAISQQPWLGECILNGLGETVVTAMLAAKREPLGQLGLRSSTIREA
jgi:hypothetical protein